MKEKKRTISGGAVTEEQYWFIKAQSILMHLPLSAITTWAIRKLKNSPEQIEQSLKNTEGNNLSCIINNSKIEKELYFWIQAITLKLGTTTSHLVRASIDHWMNSQEYTPTVHDTIAKIKLVEEYQPRRKKDAWKTKS